MSNFIPQSDAAFPTASTCIKILIDFILASPTAETDEDKQNFLPDPVEDEWSNS